MYTGTYTLPGQLSIVYPLPGKIACPFNIISADSRKALFSFLEFPGSRDIAPEINDEQTALVTKQTMDHADHVALIETGMPDSGGVWGEFGSGRGAFTLALAELLGPSGTIYSVDKDRYALQRQAKVIESRFGEQAPCVHYLAADYTRHLELPELDGILIANALHFQKEKSPVLERFYNYLHPGGRLIVVEYNVDRGNIWVPHPFSYKSWVPLAKENGFINTSLLAVHPSRFLGEIYASMSHKPIT